MDMEVSKTKTGIRLSTWMVITAASLISVVAVALGASADEHPITRYLYIAIPCFMSGVVVAFLLLRYWRDDPRFKRTIKAISGGVSVGIGSVVIGLTLRVPISCAIYYSYGFFCGFFHGLFYGA